MSNAFQFGSPGLCCTIGLTPARTVFLASSGLSLVPTSHRQEKEVDGTTGFIELDRSLESIPQQYSIPCPEGGHAQRIPVHPLRRAFSSIAFLAESKAAVISNGVVRPGTLVIAHARLLWASALLGIEYRYEPEIQRRA